MLELTLTDQGFTTNQKIGMGLFKSVGNTIVRVICIPPCYINEEFLENSVCTYMSQFLPEGVEVKTFHSVINLSSGQDSKGKYINKIDYQVYI